MDVGLIKAAIRRLRNSVDAMVCRGVVQLVNDAKRTQRLQVSILADELEDDVEHMQPYGWSFVPAVGSECIVLAVNGHRSHSVVIGAQKPGSRPKGLTDPETGGAYSKGEWRLFVDKDGVVHVGAQTGADYVALAGKVDAELQKIATTFASFSPGSGGAAFGTPYTTPPPSVAATKAKAT